MAKERSHRTPCWLQIVQLLWCGVRIGCDVLYDTTWTYVNVMLERMVTLLFDATLLYSLIHSSFTQYRCHTYWRSFLLMELNDFEYRARMSLSQSSTRFSCDTGSHLIERSRQPIVNQSTTARARRWPNLRLRLGHRHHEMYDMSQQDKTNPKNNASNPKLSIPSNVIPAQENPPTRPASKVTYFVRTCCSLFTPRFTQVLHHNLFLSPFGQI